MIDYSHLSLFLAFSLAFATRSCLLFFACSNKRAKSSSENSSSSSFCSANARSNACISLLFTSINSANEEDWSTEYLDAIISVKLVNGVEQAVSHINKYSSQHTETIITENEENASYFLTNVDSAIVMKNASTQFADGGEFGMGAEIGISTGRLHARGPVGANQLTSFKYIVNGDGQIRPNWIYEF